MLSILKSALTYFLVELGMSENKVFNDFSEIFISTLGKPSSFFFYKNYQNNYLVFFYLKNINNLPSSLIWHRCCMLYEQN